MAQDTKTIRSKMRTVASIRKMTRAMEMIARSKMKKAIDKALASRPFSIYALELLKNMTAEGTDQNPYLFAPKGAERTLIVQVAADRGLCGGYNANMLREASRYVRSHDHGEIDFVSVGKYGHSHVRKLGYSPEATFSFGEDLTLEDVMPLAEIVREKFLTGTYRKVSVAYTNYISALSQKPHVRVLYPVSPRAVENTVLEIGGPRLDDAISVGRQNLRAYLFEPSEGEVLNTVIPELVAVQLYQSLLEASASEQAARMVAMKNATENADKMSRDLELAFNRARQEGITREISEIAAGANALQ